MTKILFPPTIDSTILAAFRSCPHKAFRSYLEHWKPKTESVHLRAGGAFAKGLEEARKAFFVDGKSQSDSVALGLEALLLHYGDFECPQDSAKSLTRTAGALEYYFTQYPLGDDGADPATFADGSRGIEFSFAVPLPINHPQTGAPILYTGRADMICNYAGALYIEDDKTTSQLGASWSRAWEMRSQFTGYCWSARQYGIDTAGVLVRGVSILKTKYDTMQVLTYRPDWEVDRWYEQLLRDVRRMIAAWEEGYWDFNLDNACSEYGGCQFVQVCKSKDPTTWLKMYFEQRVWDPLAKAETTVDTWNKRWLGDMQEKSND